MRALLLSTLLLSSTLSWAHAQALPGDWVFTDLAGSRIWRTDPNTGLTAALSGYASGTGNGIAMAANNLDLVVVTFGVANRLEQRSAAGLWKFLGPVGTAPSSNGPSALDLDQDGLYVCSEADGNALHRVNPATATTTLIAVSQPWLNAVCIDQDTGDYILGVFNAGLLQRVNRVTRQVTAIASGLGSVSGVDFEPQSGSFIVTTFTSPQVRRVARTGLVTPLSVLVSANAVKVDDETGDLVVGQGVVQPYTNSIRLLAPNGGAKRTWSVGYVTPTGIEIYGSRKVSGSGPATAGSVYNISLALPKSPNAAYFMMLSTGLRPGIPMNDGSDRVVNLDVRSLVIGDIPGVTTGFVGLLSASGTATATIALPPWFPAGIRLFVTAVAQNYSQPSGFETANTWAFTTN